MKKALAALLIPLLLTACGFHLRGMFDMPRWLNNVAIISPSKNPEFISRLKTQLQAYHVAVNPEPQTAQFWLIISHIEFRQQVVSIGSSTNPRQYQLTLIVVFSLQTKNGKMIQPEKQVQVTRQFTSNNNRILGSDDEQTIIVNEMRQAAAIQVLNRISVSNHAD